MSAGHILVVDDEPGMRRYLQTVLELDSYRVSTAANGEEALEKVQRDQPDVVLLDMVMPGPDGLETLKRIREVPSDHQGRDAVLRARHPQGRHGHASRRARLPVQASTEGRNGRCAALLPGASWARCSRGRRGDRSGTGGLLLCRHRADAADTRPGHAGGALRFPGAAARRERHGQGSSGAVDPQVFRPRPSHASSR